MKKFAVVFPGQGSQYVGMGKELYDNFSIARQTFEEASDALGMSVEELCFENDEQALTMTENCQPAILTVSTAMYQVFQTEYKCVPFYAAGHSLGEYTALVISGALAFSDAVKIVRSRGRFMQEASTQDNLIAAVSGLYSDIVVEECRKVSVDNKVVVVSNFNSPQQSTISGDKSAVEAVVKNLEAIGATSTVLKVSAPFHSPFMQSAAEKLKAELNNAIHQFDSRKQEISRLNSLVQLDAKQNTITALKDNIIDKMDRILNTDEDIHVDPVQPVKPVKPKKVRQVQRAVVFNQANLSSKEDIDRYVQNIKNKLLSYLTDDDEIQIK